ncbi:ATP-grasp domain-containing protein [Thalassomonas viridans]|uniref:ATP-grasp domain-containing protein n=1 Tax=Thalassomonas viridans TaxID=137584 RepID=A0AAE9Z9Z9_9GAMM|nr:ATP-grasp domain-containing protein [Thalassomonas viridans]WDE09243.1 ATP-grasp domain-containing protein [Thalassomonas viridans]
MYLIFCGYQPKMFRQLLEREQRLILILDDKLHTLIENMRAHHARINEPFDDLLDKVKYYSIRSYDSLEELHAVCVDIKVNNYAVCGVGLLDEMRQYCAGFIASQFDCHRFLPRNPEICRDKRAMKHALKKAGVRCANFVSVADTQDPYARQQASGLAFPVIVKPASGVGSTSTFRADNAGELHKRFDQHRAGGRIISDHLIVEEFVRGEEYHCDVMWLKGQAVAFSVSKYHSPVLEIRNNDNMYLGGCSLPESKHQALYAKARALAEVVVEVAGIATGLIHMEFFVEEDTGELVFSEVGARLGGGAIKDVMLQRFGMPLLDKYISILSGDQDPAFDHEVAQDAYLGYVQFESEEEGTIVKMTPAQEIEAIDGVLECIVIRPVGSVLPRDNALCLKIVFKADDLPAFEAVMERVVALVKIETVPATPASSPEGELTG